jgi:hypothetical protein
MIMSSTQLEELKECAFYKDRAVVNDCNLLVLGKRPLNICILIFT